MTSPTIDVWLALQHFRKAQKQVLVMVWANNSSWVSFLRRSSLTCPCLTTHTRGMSSTTTNLSFPSLPPLPSRYRIRHVTTADRMACVRLIAHAFMYHNTVDVVHKEPSAVYMPIASLVFDHCMKETHNLSYVITDTQHTTPTHHTPDTTHTYDHDADRDSLADDTSIAACVLNYDAMRAPPLELLGNDPVYSQARLAVDYQLFQTLEKSDVRSQPPPPVSQPGHTMECFYLAVKCDHGGSGLARYLCRVLYSEARRLGYTALETSATHPATARIFLTQLGAAGEVTHRLRPSELVVKREDGSEEKPWADVKEDVVCVKVPIEPAQNDSAGSQQQALSSGG